MPRPRVSAENLKAALDFAQTVSTVQGAGPASFVARHGPCSMYAALGQCHPDIIRDKRPTSNRKGISDAEFLRVLAEEGSFLRYRDRKAVKMASDPTGAGMCMFKGRRWRDPRDAADLKFLREQHRILCAKHPVFANVTFEHLAATLRTIIVAWEQHMAANAVTAPTTGPLCRRASDDASSISTCYGSPTSTSTVSSPRSDPEDAVQPSSDWPVSNIGKRRSPECSTDGPSEAELAWDQKAGRSAMHWVTAAYPMASICTSGDGPCGAARVPHSPSKCRLESTSGVAVSGRPEEVHSDAQKAHPADAGALGNNTAQNSREWECVVPGWQQDLWEMSPMALEESHIAWFVDPSCEDDFDVDTTRRGLHGTERNPIPPPLG